MADCCNLLKRCAIVRSCPARGCKQNDMKRVLLVTLVLALYILHQDQWYWRTATPLLFGFLPAGLWYHAAYLIATALVMWALVCAAWPAYLEDEVDIDEHVEVESS